MSIPPSPVRLPAGVRDFLPRAAARRRRARTAIAGCRRVARPALTGARAGSSERPADEGGDEPDDDGGQHRGGEAGLTQTLRQGNEIPIGAAGERTLRGDRDAVAGKGGRPVESQVIRMAPDSISLGELKLVVGTGAGERIEQERNSLVRPKLTDVQQLERTLAPLANDRLRFRRRIRGLRTRMVRPMICS